MTHTVRSIDALINGIPEAQPINPENSPSRPENAKNDDASSNSHEKPSKSPESPDNSLGNADDYQEKAPSNRQAEEKAVTSENVQQNDENVVENAATSDNETDEYGNPVPKQKMYTEEEVQKKIRDRLKRGSFAQNPQPTQAEVQGAQDSGFQYDEGSELTWSQQMEKFVESTMSKVTERQQRAREEAIQKQVQVEFESKFHDGMSKYPDFVETLADKPVTNDMMMAIQGLQNPAAFLYTAAKRMPGELERISKIASPYVRMAEMGRLHERLSKTRQTTKAPNPLSKDRGDMTDKAPAKVSIDHLIAQDAQSRFKR